MKRLKRFIVPIFIPHEGCRFRCIFCDQYAVTGRRTPPITPMQIYDTALRYRETRPDWEGERELAFFGGSFTMLADERQRELLAVGRQLIRAGVVDTLRISTRPDAIDETILNRLVRFGVGTVELGIQSMDDDVLRCSRRGHTVSDTVKTIELLSKRAVSWVAQIMPGLPGDTEKTMIETASRVADLSPGGVRIYPALVLSGTELEHMYRRGEYNPLSLDHALEIVKTMTVIFESHSVPIIRIGLCPSIELERRIVAGPYHPAFGSLVYEGKLLDVIIIAVNRAQTEGEKTVIRVHPHDVSRAVGTGKSSIRKLEQYYPGRQFQIVADLSVKRGRVHTNGI
jgi:histone acetyltransferase (RNA polymerase elongator complex component)